VRGSNKGQHVGAAMRTSAQAAITMAGAMTTSAQQEQQRVWASMRVDAMHWQQQ